MKTRLCLVATILLCISSIAVSQIQHQGAPLSNRFTVNRNVHTVKMPPVNVRALLLEDKLEAQMKDVPYRFGQPIHVDLGIKNSGSWDTLADGRKVWRLRIQSDSAITINLIFDKFFIPSGGSMFVYNDDKSMVLGAFTEENNLSERVFSTTPIRGDRITIEYDQPLSATALPEIHISVVVHGYRDIFSLLLKSTGGFGSSGSCNINVHCPAGASWTDQARSVAMILLANNSRICTGSLINNVRNDGTPYFLTANHCWDSSQPTWILMFRYESPDCSNTDGPTTYTISGSTLLARNPDSDFCLLLLSSTPPASYNAYYGGWNRQDVAATSGTGIHHPSGDIKKISFYSSSLVSDTWLGSGAPPADSHWRVSWSAGVTEPGSSGSPIFDQNKRVVGQLHGGYSACGSTDMRDWYGKFSISWDRGTTSSTRLKDWLDPDNTAVLTLDGISSLIASISGPTSLAVGQQGIWTVTASGGTGSYTYAWYFRSSDTGGQWSGPVSTSNSYTTQMYDFDKYLDLRADVTSGSQQVSPTRHVTCTDCSGGPQTPQIVTDTVRSEALSTDAPGGVTIEQNYPNPFNPTTQIRFALPEPTHVKLIVYDMLGREVATLADGQMGAGYHSVIWNANNVSSGIYIYRLSAGNYVQVKRMLMLK